MARIPIMLPLHVEQSWYARAWLTERPPSHAARLSRRTRIAARRLAHAMSALAALYTSLLQQASDRSPSFR
jgi:hypothetical protein